MGAFELNIFTEFAEKYLSLKGFEPMVSTVRDHEATTAPVRHRIFKLTLNRVSVIYQIQYEL